MLTTQCLANLIELVASRYSSQGTQKFSFYFMSITSSVTFAIILFDDYRITVNGLIYGLLGLGTLSFATFILRSNGRLYASTQAASLYSFHRFLTQHALLISIFITGCLALALESGSDPYHAFFFVNPLLLAFNLATVATTLIYGLFNESFHSDQS
jgi:hypothetical protein